MPVEVTSKNDLYDHLVRLGVRRGQNLIVHSNLASFGKINGGAEAVYCILRSLTGPSGTIGAPTFTFQLTQRDVYSPEFTPCYQMGAFSSYLLKRGEAKRTLSPIHSYVFEGPLANELVRADPTKSTGNGSVFDIIHPDFFLLMLGCDFQRGATFVHHVEADIGVKYREWIQLPRRISVRGSEPFDIQVNYYSKKLKLPFSTNLSRLQEYCNKVNSCVSAQTHYGASSFIKLSALYDDTLHLLKKCPLSLIDPVGENW
ncbi:AAC(3) family N-acetyltransferase [Paracoccaceae bacterium]|nr:AAC(3) family N-acetyltransferase [Paracoccaceae bacterium]